MFEPPDSTLFHGMEHDADPPDQACDGTLATTAQFTAVRVVCNNTLAVAIDDSKGAFKVPHSTAFDAEAVKRQLGISVSSWDTFMYRMKVLSERKVKDDEAEGFRAPL